jgi:hypothetical protein
MGGRRRLTTATELLMAVYPWKRYWIERGGVLHVERGGYLVDPEHSHPFAPDTNLLTLEQASDTPCLVLLSEPGMGKSTTLAQHSELLRARGAIGDVVVYEDLRHYASEDRLIKKVFEAQDLQRWSQHGTGILYLLLDSIDECLLQMTNLAALLISQLKELPAERLRLRMACRTAVWCWRADRSAEI